MATTTELYEKGIEKLQAYIDVEPDKAKRDVASGQIRQLRITIQNSSFDEMTHRTARLQELSGALQGVVDSAGDGSGVSGVIADIANLIGEILQA